MKRAIILVVGLSISMCLQTINAQVQVKYNPSGEKVKEITKYKKSKTSYSIQEEALPGFNIDSVKLEDEKQMNQDKPFNA